MEIIDEGFLVKQKGVNPSTGQPHEPRWVRKADCNQDTISRWENRKDDGRTYSPSSDSDLEHADTVSIKEEVQFDVLTGARIGAKRKDPPSSYSEGHRDNSKTSHHGGRRKKVRYQFFSEKGEIKETEAEDVESSTSATHPVEKSPRALVKKDTKPFKLQSTWILQPAMSEPRGILVVLNDTFGDPLTGYGNWFNGTYEGVHGIVVSVFNIHDDDSTSTARVKFLDDINRIFAVPVKFLLPTHPEKVGQKAVVIHGEHCGSVVKLREEVDVRFFVSVGMVYFGIEAEKMAVVVDVDRDGTIL
ncbi:hypothetical protein C8Q75DRAFT_764891 [Abortiporus biennis]|nr:hypothetical protein C8Q75DRAFT_764891 [Abortiporus biennis]